MRITSIVAVFVSAFCAAATRADDIAVTGNAADGTMQQSSGALVNLPSALAMQVGSRTDTFGGGVNAVFIFQLPAIPAGHTIQSVDFQANLEQVRPSTSGSADLYGLGWATANTIAALVSNSGGRYSAATDAFWESAALEDDSTIIQAGFATSSSTADILHTSAAADASLATWIKAQYEAGATAGSYMFLRLSPTVNTWAEDRGWVFSSADSGVAAANMPRLTITTATEPLAALSVMGMAREADRFVDSIGVNVHLGYTDTVYYSNWTTLKQRLDALNIRYIRDGIPNPESWQYDDVVDRMIELKDLGLRGNLICDTRVSNTNRLLDPTRITPWLAVLRDSNNTDLRNFTIAIEGPNEYDLNKPAAEPDWVTTVRAYQLNLFNQVNSTSATQSLADKFVVAPSAGRGMSLGDYGNMADRADVGNGHVYSNTRPEARHLDTTLRNNLSNAAGMPTWVTESGWHNAMNYTSETYPVNEESGAKYQLRLQLHHLRRGVQRTFFYELCDLKPDPGLTNREHNWGLLRNDMSEKPAYTAVKNLITILSDAGSPFTPGHFAFTLHAASGNTADVRSLTFKKRNGKAYIVLWLAPDSYDNASETDIDSTFGVTLRYQQPVTGTTYLYRPLTGPGATSLGTGSVFTVTVRDDPVILEVTPSGGGNALHVYDMSSLATLVSSGWVLDTSSPQSWSGDGSRAKRSADTAANELIFPRGSDSRTIRTFSMTVAYAGASLDLSKLHFEASTTTSTGPWTNVPFWRGPIDGTENEWAVASEKYTTTLTPSGDLPAGTRYIRLRVDATGSSAKPQVLGMYLSER